MREKVSFGALECGEARGGRGLAHGGFDQRVVGGVGEAGAVDAVARGKNREVGERIGVFADPPTARDRVVERVEGIEQHLKFLLRNRDLDPEVAPPHLLHGLGEALVDFG